MWKWFLAAALVIGSCGCGGRNMSPEEAMEAVSRLTGDTSGRHVVVTNDDNDHWRLNFSDGDHIKVKLRVYPPYYWQVYDAGHCSVLERQRTKIKNSVPGDPEFDVFWLTVEPGKHGRTVSFILRDPREKENRWGEKGDKVVQHWRVMLGVK